MLASTTLIVGGDVAAKVLTQAASADFHCMDTFCPRVGCVVAVLRADPP
jgi:hypothetical protein